MRYYNEKYRKFRTIIRKILWNPEYLEGEMKNIAQEVKGRYFLLGKKGSENGSVFQEYTLFKKVGRIRVIDKTDRGEKSKDIKK